MSVSKSFVQEFVLGFGFLSGLWIYIGINPESVLINTLSDLINSISPNPMYSFAFWIIPIIATVASLAWSYFLGGWLGLVAVGLAFLGGIFIGSTFGIILLIAAIIVGFAAPLSVD